MGVMYLFLVGQLHRWSDGGGGSASSLGETRETISNAALFCHMSQSQSASKIYLAIVHFNTICLLFLSNGNVNLCGVKVKV